MGDLDTLYGPPRAQSISVPGTILAGNSGGDELTSLYGAPRAIASLTGQSPIGDNIDRSFWDVTGGALEYGAASSLESIGKFLGRNLSWDEANNFALNMKDFKDSHPEYSAPQIHGAIDLLTNPGALSSRIFAGVPQLAATSGLLLASPFTGGTSAIAAFGLNYAIASQDARDSALADGANESEADHTGELTGVVAGALSLLGAGHYIKWAPGSFKALVAMMTKEAGAAVSSLGVIGPAMKSVALGATLGAVQDGLNQLIPRGVYGKPFDVDAVQKILEAAITGGATAGVVHGVFSVLPGGSEKVSGPEPTKELDSYSRDSFKARLTSDFRHTEPEAELIAQYTDLHAKQWAKQNDSTPEQWYSTHLADDPGNIEGEVLFQNRQNVSGFYSHLYDTVENLTQEKWNSKDLLGFLKNKGGVKDEELQWTGLGDLLTSGPAKITKGEVENWLDSHQVVIAENIHEPRTMTEWENQMSELRDAQTKAGLDKEHAYSKLTELIVKMREKPNPTPEDLAKVTEAKDTYNQLNEQFNSAAQAVQDLRSGPLEGSLPKYEDYTLPGDKSNYREILIRFPRYTEPDNGKIYEADMSPERVKAHWSEKNIIAHLRVDDRVALDGTKILQVEELQSDWRNAKQSETELKAKGLPPNQAPVNDAPFISNPTPLLIRRALIDAVEHGRDAIGLTTGEQQVERYDAGGFLTEDQASALRKGGEIALKTALKEAKKLDPSAEIEWKVLSKPNKIEEFGKIHYNDDESITWYPHSNDLPQTFESQEAFQKYADTLTKAISVPTIKITNTMRDSIVDGLPLFQRAPRWESMMRKVLSLTVLRDGTHLVMQGDHAQMLEQEGIKPKDVLFTTKARIGKEGELTYDPSITTNDSHGVKPFDGEVGPQSKSLGEYRILPNESSGEGNSFFQFQKASTTFLRDGRAVLRALQSSDQSSALHELFHIFRRDLQGEDAGIAAKWAGAEALPEGGFKWTREAEEKFARGGEAYLREGKSPHPMLNRVFEAFKEWFKTVYRIFKGSDIDVGISDEMRGVYDRLTVEDTTDVSVARQNVLAKGAEYQTALEKLKTAGPDAQDPNEVESLRLRYEGSKRQLETLQQAQVTPEGSTSFRNRRDEALEASLSAETPSRSKLRTQLSGMAKPIQQFLTKRLSGLEVFPAGKEAIDRMANAVSYMLSLKGEHAASIAEGKTVLSSADKKWLREVDDFGVSNWRKLIDKAGVRDPQMAPSPTLQKYENIARELYDAVSEEAEKYGVLRKLSGGRIPSKAQDVMRAPRVFTRDGYEAIARGSGKFWDAIVDATLKLNPKLDRVLVSNRLQSMYGKSVVREVGSVEESRNIRYMPDTVKVGGRWIDLMVQDTYRGLEHMIVAPARRIGVIKEFGQGLTPVVDPNSKTPLSPLIRLTKALGKPWRMTAEDIALELQKHNTPRSEVYKALSTSMMDFEESSGGEKLKALGTLQKLAKDAGISSGFDQARLLEQINSTSTKELSKSQLSEVRKLAKEFGGIDWKSSPENLLSELKQRVVEKSDDVLSDLRNAIKRQGGSDTQFVNAFRLLQGLPVGWSGEGTLWRSWKTFQNVLSGLQTSLSFAPTIPQTLIQIPHMTGIKNYVEAVKDVIKDYRFTRAQGVAMGAIPEEVFRHGVERGFALEEFGRKIREFFGKPMEWVINRNYAIAFRAFQRYADQLKIHGAENADLQILRGLYLSEAELKDAKSGTINDETYKKIVQNGVSGTQYDTEPLYRRGIIESSPLSRALFAYSNYTAGTLRNAFTFGNDIISAVKSGDAKQMATMAGRTVVFLSGALGAGFASELLRQIAKGNLATQPLHKDWEHRLTGALAEVGLLGPTQRLLEPLNPESGDGFDKAFASIMPQISTLGQVLSTLVGKGRFGQFDTIGGLERTSEANLAPAKAIHNWLDLFAFPQYPAYLEARKVSLRFEREVLDKPPEPSANAPLKPETTRVFELVSRSDLEGSVQAAKAYYAEEIQKMRDNPLVAVLEGKSVPQLSQELRSSLLARAPIRLNTLETAKMLSTLPLSERRTILQAQLRYAAIVNAIAPSGN